MRLDDTTGVAAVRGPLQREVRQDSARSPGRCSPRSCLASIARSYRRKRHGNCIVEDLAGLGHDTNHDDRPKMSGEDPVSAGHLHSHHDRAGGTARMRWYRDGAELQRVSPVLSNQYVIVKRIAVGFGEYSGASNIDFSDLSLDARNVKSDRRTDEGGTEPCQGSLDWGGRIRAFENGTKLISNH